MTSLVALASFLAALIQPSGRGDAPGEWLVASYDPAQVIAIDLASIERAGSTITIRTIIIFGGTESLDSGTRYDYSVQSEAMYCDRNERSLIDATLYLVDGTETAFIGGDPDIQTVTPGTTGHDVQVAACEGIAGTPRRVTPNQLTIQVRDFMRRMGDIP